MKITERASRIAPSLTLEITAKAKKLKAEGVGVVSFGAGEPDFNTPDYIIEAAKDALDRGLTKYTPAAGTLTLRQAICDKLKRDNGLDYAAGDIVVSNGAKHALANAFLATVEAGEEVIIPAPYWLTYPELVKLAEGVPVYVHTSAKNSFKITPTELEKAITDKTRAVLINNPNNPTGAVYTREEIEALAAVLRKYPDIYIISDEIYEKLCYGVEPYSIAACEGMRERTVIVNGVSKTYAMTGWRIGYTASATPLAKAIGSMQSHMASNANTIAQYASEAALVHDEGEKFLKLMRETFDRRRQLMIRLLDGMPQVTYIEPLGAFYVMVGIEGLLGKTLSGCKIDTALDFANALLEKEKVAVIPCESFGADGYIRLSYAISESDIAHGLDGIKRFIAG
ncbi:MAG: pyridoxal phosphate-dependent aminotransferase [Clostridia bacterium]|nr:pyridoxal phosphate-dependent aminotransferase [Clostridia bacterium]